MLKKTILSLSVAAGISAASSFSASAADNFTLIHSAWLGGWQWQHVEGILTEKGATVNAPDLPGHGQDKTPTAEIDLQSYVDRITKVLDENDAPTILVGHSFGGVVASQVAEARPEKVKALVYLCAFLLPDGASFLGAVEGVTTSEVLNNLVFNDDKSLVGIKEEALHHAVGADVPLEAFEAAKPFLVLEPTKPLGESLSLSDERYGSIPRYYVQCTEDHAIPPAIQAAMIENLPVEKAYSVEASHLPVFSQPQGVADILIDVAARETLRADVLVASEGWQSAFNQGDAAGATAFYEKDAVMNAIPIGTFAGKDKILDFWTKLIKDGAKDIRYIEPNLNILDKDRATITSRWAMNVASGIIHKELWVRQDDNSVLLREDDFEILP